MTRRNGFLCQVCGNRVATRSLNYVCGHCLKGELPPREEIIERAHGLSRELPPYLPPRDPEGIACLGCGNKCQIGKGQEGFCRLRRVEKGKMIIKAGTSHRGLGSFYFDSLPTNCVADWVCPGGTGAGYPYYAYRPGPERGYYNLAVFLGACSFDCLYCQNRSYYEMALTGDPLLTPQDLVRVLEEDTACICFFGGDPSPQMAFTLAVARQALSHKKNRILRICWETNGNIHPRYLDEMAEIALNSGGVIKFDLKAWDENLHRALTGASNRQTLANFRYLCERYFRKRLDPPLLVASTLMVPGYVEREEVESIARFLAHLDPDIPYTLLAFCPQHLMRDLPLLSRRIAESCLEAAYRAGLKRVRIGNLHLLR
ncbi:MAG TPA: radical SAM protein [Moorella mulderi]|nr:radical SAM protein [Moorella mulderi]